MNKNKNNSHCARIKHATATNKTLTKTVDISNASEKIIIKHIIINCPIDITTME